MKKLFLALALVTAVGATHSFAQDGDKKNTTTSTTKKKDKKKNHSCCQSGSTGQTCDKKKEK